MSETTVHTRYSTTVDTLEQAWSFVMTHVDKWPEPRIEIAPMWEFESGEDERQVFEVSVSGDVIEDGN